MNFLINFKKITKRRVLCNIFVQVVPFLHGANSVSFLQNIFLSINKNIIRCGVQLWKRLTRIAHHTYTNIAHGHKKSKTFLQSRFEVLYYFFGNILCKFLDIPFRKGALFTSTRHYVRKSVQHCRLDSIVL